MTDFNTYYNTLANAKNVSRADVLLYCLMKAIRAKNEDKISLAQALVHNAFTPPSKPCRILNGALNYWGFHHAVAEFRWKYRAQFPLPFEHTEDEATMLRTLVGLLKAPN